MAWKKRGCLWVDKDDPEGLSGYFDEERVEGSIVEDCMQLDVDSNGKPETLTFVPGKKEGQWFCWIDDERLWIFDNRDRKQSDKSPDFNITQPEDDGKPSSKPAGYGRPKQAQGGWKPRPQGEPQVQPRAAAPPVLPWYAVVLGLKEWPVQYDVLKDAYRVKAKQLHPDAGGTTKAFQDLQAALSVAEDVIKDDDDEIPF